MHRRTVRTTALFLAGVMAVVLVPVLGLASPVAAAPVPYTLTMSEGSLALRGSEEPAALETPTTITGTNDGGTMTGGTLSTPSIEFTQRVTSPAETDVYIEASFGQVTPGSLVGNIDQDGYVTLSSQLRVDLEIEVEILPGEHYSCTTSPISITLEGQHSGPEGTPADTVELTDENFTVPSTSATPDCPQFIVDNLNEQLAGSGHSLSLTMSGHLDRPVDPGDPSLTALAVSTPGPIQQGDEVTLTATVTPAPEAEETSIPSGFVTFLDGSHVLGEVPLDGSGVASLATTSVLAGNRQLRARYEGSAPLYAGSISDPTALQVIAHPTVIVDLPSALQVGGSVDFPVEAANPGFAEPITNARLDVTIQRGSGSATIANPRITLASVVDGTPTTIPLTQTGTGAAMRLRGSIGLPTGTPLAPGEALEAVLRLGAAANTALVGGLRVTVALVAVDGGGVVTETVAQGSDDMALVSANRVETQIIAGQAGIPEFEIPETPAVVPTRVRAGNVVSLSFFQVGPESVGPLTGDVTFSVAGRVLQVRDKFDSGAIEWRSSLPPTLKPEILIPRDIGPGPHVLTVSYGGDAKYRPATASFPFTVVGAIGPNYDCRAAGTFTGRFRAQLEGRATLPTVARPGTIGLANLSLSLHFARGGQSLIAFQEIPGNPDREIDLAFGPDGTGTAADVVQVNNTELLVNDASPVDHSVVLQTPTGQAVVEGDPGETVPVTVDSLEFAYPEDILGARNSITCTPVDGPLTLGSVTVAGTSLVPSAAHVGSGRDLTLQATTLPGGPGTVEFRDGGTTIGVVPTTDGSATLITSDLPAGTAEIVAIFRGAPLPTTTSNTVTVEVIADCPNAVEAGNGAIVRLAYIELLRRCPDQDGYEYWRDQLDAGTVTPEGFAKRISDSKEARMIIVDDAYDTMLERAPEPGGRDYWADWLGQNGRYDGLLAELGASPEFRQLAEGTDSGVVTRVYERIAQRSPDPDGLAYWLDFLEARGIRRLVKAFFNAPEPLARVVTDSYQEILERDPTPAEIATGSEAMRANSDRSALYASIIGLGEFDTRAQTFPPLVV
jgi:hypothetical protein